METGNLKTTSSNKSAAPRGGATAAKPAASGPARGGGTTANGKATEASASAAEQRLAGDPARGQALNAALTQIERQFGQGSVMRLGDDAAAVRVAIVPTGALSLDLALGVGGVPRGKIVEIFGPESSGKTTLVYEIIAQAQRMGPTTASRGSRSPTC